MCDEYFSYVLEHCVEIFIDDFSVYGSSFEICLANLERCVETNLVLNFEKFHFMVERETILGHIICRRGIEVDLARLDFISQLLYPLFV